MQATKNILIVDDEPLLRATLAAIVRNAGYHTCVAASAKEALELLKIHSFQLALLDVRMPGVSGIQLLFDIKQLYPDLMVVILTGYATPEMATQATDLGVVDFISKPIEPANLLDRLNNYWQEKISITREVSGHIDARNAGWAY